MKFKELTDKTTAELQKLLKAKREKLRELRFKVANKQLKDVREIREVRQIISQTLTILNQRKESTPLVDNSSKVDK
jgi:large subunit ribosomal protein L29